MSSHAEVLGVRLTPIFSGRRAIQLITSVSAGREGGTHAHLRTMRGGPSALFHRTAQQRAWVQGLAAVGPQVASKADWRLCRSEVDPEKPSGAIWPRASHPATFQGHPGAPIYGDPEAPPRPTKSDSKGGQGPGIPPGRASASLPGPRCQSVRWGWGRERTALPYLLLPHFVIFFSIY